MTKEKETNDVLDQVKKAEKVTKVNLLIKRLAELKKLARQVLEIKEKSVMILEDTGVSEDDIKRVIDFINSLPEVQLSEVDKKDLREEVKRSGKSKREEVQKEIEQHPFLGGSGLNYFSANPAYGSTAASSVVLTSATSEGNNTLQIKI